MRDQTQLDWSLLPKPGQEAWGYDKRFQEHNIAEYRMDPDVAKEQLKQRFKLKIGTKIDLGSGRVAEVIKFDEKRVYFYMLGEATLSHNDFSFAYVLHYLNNDYWKIVPDKLEE